MKWCEIGYNLVLVLPIDVHDIIIRTNFHDHPFRHFGMVEIQFQIFQLSCIVLSLHSGTNMSECDAAFAHHAVPLAR